MCVPIGTPEGDFSFDSFHSDDLEYLMIVDVLVVRPTVHQIDYTIRLKIQITGKFSSSQYALGLSVEKHK